MKTKLFSLFIAVFMFGLSGIAQTYPTITLIGSGNGGWTNEAETALLTSDGITYTLVDKVLTAGEVKFREGRCWPTGVGACLPGSVTNPNGWGPALSTQTGWPSGANNAPVDAGPNIQSQAGVWTITFNRIQGSWSFVPGTPLPVIKLVGTAVVAAGGAALTTANGVVFTAKKVALKSGACKIDINGTSYGSAVAPGFPTGTADALTGSIAVTSTGIDYDVTFDYTTGDYTFKVATFPQVAIVGAAAGGWPPSPQPVGYVDSNIMSTTDGVIYTIKNIPLSTGPIKFRQNNDWGTNWGGSTWPSGPTNGNDIPAIAGNYNGTFNRTTSTYTFTLNSPAVVGSGVGGWPPSPQPVGYLDPKVLSTVDGVNYTLNGLVVTAGAAKFRMNNDWGVNTGGDLFPAGPKTGNDIPTTAGTYNLKYNIITGAYDFGTNLSVNKFDTASFKAYPNPTTDSWNIVSGNDDIKSIQVYDVLGKSVYARTAASKEVSINASELSRGVYYAKVATENGKATVKLVKE